MVRYTKGKDFPVPNREFKPDKDTVVLYHFNEGKGDNTKDESEYENNGEVSNAEWTKSDAPIGPAVINARGKLSTTWARIKTY